MPSHRHLDEGDVGWIDPGEATRLSQRAGAEAPEHLRRLPAEPFDGCEVEFRGNRSVFGVALTTDLAVGTLDEGGIATVVEHPIHELDASGGSGGQLRGEAFGRGLRPPRDLLQRSPLDPDRVERGADRIERLGSGLPPRPPRPPPSEAAVGKDGR